MAYNTEHGLDPTPLRKRIADITDLIAREDADTDELIGGGGRQRSRGKAPTPGMRSGGHDAGRHAAQLVGLPAGDLADLIQQLTDQMHAAAGDLQFELAARLRDEVGGVEEGAAADARGGREGLSRVQDQSAVFRYARRRPWWPSRCRAADSTWRPPVRLASLSVRASLIVVGAVGLAVALSSSGLALTESRRVADLDAMLVEHQRAQTLTREIDTRAGELKVDAYKAMLMSRPADEQTELADDFGQLTSRLEALQALPLHSDDRADAQKISATFDAYVLEIRGLVDLATSDARAAAGRFQQVQAANDRTDQALGHLQEALDSDAATLLAEANAARDRLRVGLLITVGFGVALIAGATILLGGSVRRRLGTMQTALQSVADGDLTVRTGADGDGDLERMGRALDRALERIAAALRAASATGAQVVAAADQVHEVAARVAKVSDSAADEVQHTAGSADDVSRNVELVAAGSEEMGSSIAEIARSAHEAAEVATAAVQTVQSTTSIMIKLGESSREIGDVVKLITSIAEQTNLLALNATIEAARAGDSGKGFAVVADEVKQLAQETARATEDISRRIESIQQDAEQASGSISNVADVIGRINEFQTTIASAVEEQTATTKDMNHCVVQAATGSGEIARQLGAVVDAVRSTADSAGGASGSAEELKRAGRELEQALAGFRF